MHREKENKETKEIKETKESSLKLLHINTSSTRIQAPKQNYLYHIKDKALPDGEAIIRFAGNLKNLRYFNLANFNYRKIFREEDHLHLTDFMAVSRDSLPKSVRDNHLPPLLFYSKSAPNTLHTIRNMSIGIYNEPSYTVTFSPVQGVSIYNDALQHECQQLSKTIPVIAGEYPLFQEPKRPSLEFLVHLYHNFLQYNNHERLVEQNNKSENYCTARAHFVSTLLGQYGITTIKLYKRWTFEQWQQFNPERRCPWKFHCATLIIDSDNHKWVWDPWIGFNKQLLTLTQWLHRKDEPTPMKLIIANSAIISDFTRGRFVEPGLKNRGPCFFNAFQATCGSAIPNPPEHSLTAYNRNQSMVSMKRSTFFSLCQIEKRIQQNESLTHIK